MSFSPTLLNTQELAWTMDFVDEGCYDLPIFALADSYTPTSTSAPFGRGGKRLHGCRP